MPIVSYTIKQYLDLIANEKILLPSFQRPYVWEASRVKKLFDSILVGYPISTMLGWHGSFDPNNRPARCFSMINLEQEVCTAEDIYILLDGQQRTRSLREALSPQGNNCGLYVDFSHVPFFSQESGEILLEDHDEDEAGDDNDGDVDSVAFQLTFFENNGPDGQFIGLPLHAFLQMESGAICGLVSRQFDDRFHPNVHCGDLVEKREAALAACEHIWARLNNSPIIHMQYVTNNDLIQGNIPLQVQSMFVRANHAGKPVKKTDLIIGSMETLWAHLPNNKTARNILHESIGTISNQHGCDRRKFRNYEELLIKSLEVTLQSDISHAAFLKTDYITRSQSDLPMVTRAHARVGAILHNRGFAMGGAFRYSKNLLTFPMYHQYCIFRHEQDGAGSDTHDQLRYIVFLYIASKYGFASSGIAAKLTAFRRSMNNALTSAQNSNYENPIAFPLSACIDIAANGIPFPDHAHRANWTTNALTEPNNDNHLNLLRLRVTEEVSAWNTNGLADTITDKILLLL